MSQKVPDYLCHAVEKCCETLQNDVRIRALYLVGSMARGNPDCNSDIDLSVIVSQGQLNPILIDAENIASKIENYILGDFFPDTNSYSALYDIKGHIVKIDYDYYELDDKTIQSFKSSFFANYFMNRRLLFDHNNTAESIVKSSLDNSIRTNPPTMAHFLISMWSILRMINRGEILEALDILNYLRDPLIISMLCRIHDVPYENYRRLEYKLSKSDYIRLCQTYALPQREQILNATGIILDMYIGLLNKLNYEIQPNEYKVIEQIRRNCGA